MLLAALAPPSLAPRLAHVALNVAGRQCVSWHTLAPAAFAGMDLSLADMDLLLADMGLPLAGRGRQGVAAVGWGSQSLVAGLGKGPSVVCTPADSAGREGGARLGRMGCAPAAFAPAVPPPAAHALAVPAVPADPPPVAVGSGPMSSGGRPCSGHGRSGTEHPQGPPSALCLASARQVVAPVLRRHHQG